MEKLIIIKTLAELRQLKEYIKDKEYIAFDTETTGVVKESKVVGFSICADIEVGYYVVLSYWDVEQQKLIDLETLDEAYEFLKLLVDKRLIMHNGLFDCYMVENNYKLSLINSLHTDTLMLGHLLDENRSNGLKELGSSIFGLGAKAEQIEVKENVHKNGGKLTRDCYELYKADADILGKYGAKDAILTLKLFYHLVPELYDQGLESFFYDNECMPLLKGPTYHMNTTGLKIDMDKLLMLKRTLEAECLEAKALIFKEIMPYIQHKYPGTNKRNEFNIQASKQISWLLFIVFKAQFMVLTKEGKELCKALDLKLPYAPAAKRNFISIVESKKGHVYQQGKINPKTGKMGRPKKIGDPQNYLCADKITLKKYADQFVWVKKLLEYSKNKKLLSTYIEGIIERQNYNIIQPNFLQHGTTSGRYSCKNPNFQNLPRDDKRIKDCIVARPGKVFIGADYSQLEPRVFASFSKDERLLNCFKIGDDFYSVIGAEISGYKGLSLKKDAANSFAKTHPEFRNIAKTVALAATYGTTAPKMASILNKSMDEAQEIIDNYFEAFPSVKQFMLESHELAKASGVAYNAYGRPRHIPKAKLINKIYGKTEHKGLPYEIRNILNLSVNHRVQSTGASIMNRAAIEVASRCQELALLDPKWGLVRIVMQVHDELILEGPQELGNDISILLKDCMENTTALPGVDLVAEPKIGKTLAELK